MTREQLKEFLRLHNPSHHERVRLEGIARLHDDHDQVIEHKDRLIAQRDMAIDHLLSLLDQRNREIARLSDKSDDPYRL